MKKGVIGAGIVVCIGIISLAIYNMTSNTEFFKASISNLLTVTVSIVFAFFFTQRLTDDRKKKQVAESLVQKIQNEISDSRFCNIETQSDVDYIGIKIRTISNNIECLKQISKKLKIVEEVNYIDKKFENYENLYGNHMSQIEHLKNSSIDFKNNIECIDSKCTYIIIKFYI